MATKAPTPALAEIAAKLMKLPGSRQMFGSQASLVALPADWVLEMASKFGLIALPPPLPARQMPLAAPIAAEPIRAEEKCKPPPIGDTLDLPVYRWCWRKD